MKTDKGFGEYFDKKIKPLEDSISALKTEFNLWRYVTIGLIVAYIFTIMFCVK